MKLVLYGHPFRYEMERVVMMFFPLQKITVLEQEALPDGDWVKAVRKEGVGSILLEAACRRGGEQQVRSTRLSAPKSQEEVELALGRLLYELLSGLTQIRPPWGILTGVRPVKLLRELDASHGQREADALFSRRYLVSPNKLELARSTEGRERAVLERSTPDSFSLYVSLPFCPSRCRYCSFVSHAIGKARRLLPEYLELLARELAVTGSIARELGLRLRTVYFGGGTPTTLEADELSRLMEAVASSFDLSGLWEYTVEAGRPDTITREKLMAIKRSGAGRVSVNPQTFHDRVLETMGREHTVAQFYEGFALAREAGFDCINLDLIAGLPGDNLDGFQESLHRALELRPENLTLHTLSVKRAAELNEERLSLLSGEYSQAVEMVDRGYRALQEAGYAPYYLYRQRHTAGNLENTGFCLPGKEGMYNVYIMAETQTILAVGAGGVSKIISPVNGRLHRVYNHKYPYEYNARFEEILSRKAGLRRLYGGENWEKVHI